LSEQAQAGSGTLTRLSSFLALLKEALLIVAILVGGGWALFRYEYLESSAAKVRHELDLAKARERIQLATRIEQTIAREGEQFIIFGDVTIKNEGSKTVLFTTNSKESPPVTLYKFDLVKATPIKENVITAYVYDEGGDVLEEISLDPGRSVSLPFVILAPGPGLYTLNIAFPVDQELLSPAEARYGSDWAWSEQKVLFLH
jgi:hypothetical protein